MRAPGEGVASGASGGIGEADAIASARAALAGLDPANLRAILGSDHTATQTDAPRTRVPVAPLMDDMPGDRAHAGESLQSTTGGTSTNSRNGSANVSQRPDPDASSHPGKNNFMKVGCGDNNFYPSQWSLVRDIPGEGSVTFVAGNTIAIEASSLAYPPTNQFRWTATAEPLNDDGTPQVSIGTPGWSDPVEYSSGLTGGGTPNHFVLRATSPAPKQRWTISIPIQEDAHGNYLDDRLGVYTPQSE